MKKTIMFLTIVISAAMIFSACQGGITMTNKIDEKENNTTTDLSNTDEIWLAGGCFWGVEEYFSRIDGVIDVTSGYANGATQDPSYQDVINNLHM